MSWCLYGCSIFDKKLWLSSAATRNFDCSKEVKLCSPGKLNPYWVPIKVCCLLPKKSSVLEVAMKVKWVIMWLLCNNVMSCNCCTHSEVVLNLYTGEVVSSSGFVLKTSSLLSDYTCSFKWHILSIVLFLGLVVLASRDGILLARDRKRDKQGLDSLCT